MEEQDIKQNQECRIVETQPGSFVYFDNTGLDAPQNIIYQEFQKEFQAVIRREAQVTHANLIKYTNLEKYEGKLYLGRVDPPVKEFRQWEAAGLADTCRVLLTILEIMRTYHTCSGADQQDITLGGLSRGQLKQDDNGGFWLQDPPVMNHLHQSADPLYRVDFAPEVMKGQRWDESSDVFSWGALAYRLLSGKDPFQTNTLEDRISKILRAKIISLKDQQPQLSEDLCQLIMDCLTKPARQRPSVTLLIGKLTVIINTGNYQISAEATLEYAGKAKGNLKKYWFQERFWLWFRRYGLITSVITGLILFFLVFAFAFNARGKHYLSVHTPPGKVVDYYYKSIITLNTPLQDETLYWVKKRIAFGDEIDKLNLFRDTGYFINLAYTEFHGRMLMRNKTKAMYRAEYILWIQMGDNHYQNIQRVEILTLRSVFNVWRITGIKVFKEKRWTTGAKESKPVDERLLASRFKTAAAISRKKFLCESNPLHLQSLTLCFERIDSCVLHVSLNNQTNCQFPVGLDGKYRTAISNGVGPMAFRGSWDSENTFTLSWRDIKKSAPMGIDMRLIFNGKKVSVEFTNPLTGDSGKFQGRMQE